MSDNPFIKGYTKGFYSDFVLEQIKDLDVGDSIKADFGINNKSKFRSTLSYSAASIGVGVKTRTGSDGSLWIARIR